jgi:hypothetical protein
MDRFINNPNVRCLTADDDIESCLDFDAMKFKLGEINKLINILSDSILKNTTNIENSPNNTTNKELFEMKKLIELRQKNVNILKKLMNERKKINCKLEEKIPVSDFPKQTSQDLNKKTITASDSINILRDSQNIKDYELYTRLVTLYNDLINIFNKYEKEFEPKEKNTIYFQQIVTKLEEYERILEDIQNYDHPDCLTFGGKKKKGRKTNKRTTKRKRKANKRTAKRKRKANKRTVKRKRKANKY